MMWPSRPTGRAGSCRSSSTSSSSRCPTPRRCYKLGQAIGRAIRAYPEDLKVAMVGTGGLSHQLIGDRAGFNNEAWDLEFLDLIDRDPSAWPRCRSTTTCAWAATKGRGHHVAHHARRASSRACARSTRATICP
jgi:aromatic ring-opening dioxygenase catalytic subunit (LigB family)